MRHTYSCVLIHGIFATKLREPAILDSFRDQLHSYIAGIIKKEIGMPIAVDGVADHVHAFFACDPDIALSKAFNRVKSISSGWLHREFKDARLFAWQEGYAAFSVSYSNMGAVAAYVKQQQAHHRHVSFLDEYKLFLKRHGIEFDPMHLV